MINKRKFIMKDKHNALTAAKASSPSNTQEKECFSSQALFAGQQEIVIEHAGQSYRLRITRQDKLILTK